MCINKYLDNIDIAYGNLKSGEKVVAEYKAENRHIIINDESLDVYSKEINIAVILPFKLSSAGSQSPYSDYYKGLLLALDSLKNNGLKANVYTFDTNGDTEKITEILQKPEMQKNLPL